MLEGVRELFAIFIKITAAHLQLARIFLNKRIARDTERAPIVIATSVPFNAEPHLRAIPGEPGVTFLCCVKISEMFAIERDGTRVVARLLFLHDFAEREEGEGVLLCRPPPVSVRRRNLGEIPHEHRNSRMPLVYFCQNIQHDGLRPDRGVQRPTCLAFERLRRHGNRQHGQGCLQATAERKRTSKLKMAVIAESAYTPVFQVVHRALFRIPSGGEDITSISGEGELRQFRVLHGGQLRLRPQSNQHFRVNPVCHGVACLPRLNEEVRRIETAPRVRIRAAGPVGKLTVRHQHPLQFRDAGLNEGIYSP